MRILGVGSRRYWAVAVLLSVTSLVDSPVGRAQAPVCDGGAASAVQSGINGRVLSLQDLKRTPLRGFDLGPRGRFGLTSADIQALVATNANLVRVWITLQRCQTCDGYTPNGEDVAAIERLRAQAGPLGIRIIVVLGMPSDIAPQDFWGDASLKESIVGIWRKLARKYVGDPVIAGYDLLNEPKPLDRATQVADWDVFMRSIVEAVREADPDHLIFVEPPLGGSVYGFQAILDRPPILGVVYSLHTYAPGEVTHQGLYDYKEAATYPSAKWTRSWLSSRLDPVRKFVSLHKAPVYVGEFGCVRWGFGSGCGQWVDDMISLFEAERWTWTVHAFREYHGWDYEIPADAPHGIRQSDAAALRDDQAPGILLLKSYFLRNRHGCTTRP